VTTLLHPKQRFSAALPHDEQNFPEIIEPQERQNPPELFEFEEEERRPYDKGEL
jgi:hypothetical protein